MELTLEEKKQIIQDYHNIIVYKHVHLHLPLIIYDHKIIFHGSNR